MKKSSAGKHAYGVTEEQSTTGHFGTDGIHHVTASFLLARVLKYINHFLFNILFFFGVVNSGHADKNLFCTNTTN
jgi:hypothetical protein